MAESKPAGKSTQPQDAPSLRARIDTPDESEVIYQDIFSGMASFTISGRLLGLSFGPGAPPPPAPPPPPPPPSLVVHCTLAPKSINLKTAAPATTTLPDVPVVLGDSTWSVNCATDMIGDATLTAVLRINGVNTVQDSVDLFFSAMEVPVETKARVMRK